MKGGVQGGVVGGEVGGEVGGKLGGVVGSKGSGPPPAPPPPVVSDAPVRLTKDMVPARPLRKVEPVYPRLAREARLEGRVMLMLTVDRFGRVTAAKALSGPDILRSAALEAALQWTWEPSRTKDGVAVATYIPLPMEFKLQQ